MNNLIILLRKEFRQIFRNPSILRMILIMPIIQLIIIPLAADFEIKNISVSIVDLDHSSYSRRLVEKMGATGYFKLVEYGESYSNAMETVRNGKSDIIFTIPANFEENIVRENKAKIHIAADAVNGVRAGLGSSYAAQIVGDFNREIRSEWLSEEKFNSMPQIEISSAGWYNPHFNYHLFMVPGILAILVTMVGSFMTSLNIVSEKEAGTIEQLNVTPLKKHEFILGKLIPFWILGLVSISMGMVVAYFVFGIVPVGHYLTIYGFAAVYLLSVLGIGLFISTMVETQQQSTLFSFFFMMVFILMGGLYTPIESMPDWAQWIAAFNPPAYFIKIIRAVFLKGSDFVDLLPDFYKLIGFALVFNLLAVLNYRKRMA